MPQPIKETTRRAWSLANTGYNTAEIGKIMGLPTHTVSSMINRGRNKGVVRQKTERDKTLRALLKKNHVTMGNMAWILGQLTPEQRLWVIDEVIKYKCETVAELVVELLRDAYAESGNDS